MSISRRHVLVGGAVAVPVAGVAGIGLVARGVLPGQSHWQRIIGDCDTGSSPPAAASGPSLTGTFPSAARRTDVRYTIWYPPGSEVGSALHVCVALHGRSGDHTFADSYAAAPRFLAAEVAAGPTAPFALVGVDGGDAVNWHRRSDGDDPVVMIRDELLPTLAAKGLRTGTDDRIGVWGWSLGGFGALHLAAVWGPKRVAASVATSPAIWRTFDDAQPGTFDDRADFDRCDLFRRADSLVGVAVRIDCGLADPFAEASAQFRSLVDPAPEGAHAKGCHDSPFAWSVAREEVRFLGSKLEPEPAPAHAPAQAPAQAPATAPGGTAAPVGN